MQTFNLDREYEATRQRRIAAGEPMKAPAGCPCEDERDCSHVAICRAVEEVYEVPDAG